VRWAISIAQQSERGSVLRAFWHDVMPSRSIHCTGIHGQHINCNWWYLNLINQTTATEELIQLTYGTVLTEYETGVQDQRHSPQTAQNNITTCLKRKEAN